MTLVFVVIMVIIQVVVRFVYLQPWNTEATVLNAFVRVKHRQRQRIIGYLTQKQYTIGNQFINLNGEVFCES